jgi:SAM-dependent methyltransferase
MLQNIKNRIKFWGLKYYCVMCHSHVNKMLPMGVNSYLFKKSHIIGGGYRENAVCPVCNSLDRERMIYYFLKNHTKIFKSNCSILHFAPEENLHRKLTANSNCQYISGDITPGKADYVVDITKIQFDENRFDYIICNHVLEHIPDEQRAISEMKRVLKPNGRIIITMPICISNPITLEDENIITRADRLKVYGQEDHVRLYGSDVKKRLSSYGLKVLEYNFAIKEGKKKLNKYSITNGDRLFFCRK